MKSGHTSGAGTSSRRKHISNRDIFNEFGVKIGLCVSCTEDVRQDKFWFGVLKTALFALRDS